jgi:transcription termination factor Rho
VDSENQESTPEVTEASASAPRKRAPRRVVSTDLPEKGTDQVSEKKPEAKSDDAQSGEEKPVTERPRRRRPAADKSESSAAESESSESSDDSEGSDDNGEGGGYGRGRGRGRGRDRRRGGGRGGFSEDGEPEISDDDVLIPIGGILDVLDNYAFVRTQGYLPGPTDVYVSLGQVKKYNLRKGDAVIGAIRQPREGENQGRQKYNALVSVDSINGQTVDEAANRVDFQALTAVYPTDRIRMETAKDELAGRFVDVFTPVGKGQRGVIVGPAGSGKSHMVASMAAAVAQNAPDAHLMVVLVDEQPEAITEMQRGAKGEVITSTFDRSADDHTTIAELAIERAKRLVELGHDVVVFLDSLTRLARAYQQSIGGASRGGSDSAWVYPTKKLFGAARNVEGGGSLTIIGTLATDTGMSLDDVVASEIAGTATMELRLSQDAAASRLFPAIDIRHSGTRKDDQLLSVDELRAIADIRQGVGALDSLAGVQSVLEGMKSSASNVEFLVAMPKKF